VQHRIHNFFRVVQLQPHYFLLHVRYYQMNHHHKQLLHQSDGERQFLKKLSISNFTSRGSSLKVADISSGKADLYFTTTDKIKQWDTCASSCLVREAGGLMTDMSGKDLKYNTKTVNHQNGILVTNGIIHNEIIKKYAEFSNP